uniref:NADH-ubiquinone oxidoreductase chain 3 n=1 Tax=Gondogeneia antarctica TaxID=1109128 RepID=G8IQP9_GONAN|nr:NADH dehydrogenase subunit 3 [Gondogeneia antarctica]
MASLSFFISMLLALLALTISKKTHKDREKMSPFECGFDPFKKARMPFSLRFFLVTIIFLIFDVEIALLMPLGLILSSSPIPMLIITMVLILLILILGLIHEWNQGALNWVY